MRSSRPSSPAGPSVELIPDAGRVLAFDLGSVRIGVAVSDAGQRLATGRQVVTRTGDRQADHRALARLVADEEAVGVVIGVPLSLSGAVGPAATGVLDEVEDIRAAVAVPLDTVDERLTTVAARQGLRAAGIRERQARPKVDAAAAAVFLQGWLDRRHAAKGALR